MLVISPLPPGGSWASITVLGDGMLRFDSLWDPDLKDALKEQIPATDRRAVYEGRKFQYWMVLPEHAETLADLAEKYHQGRPQVPQADPWDSVDPKTQVLLECGHYATIKKYPIKPWPGCAYCPICEMTVVTDAHRRDIEEEDPWDSVGG